MVAENNNNNNNDNNICAVRMNNQCRNDMITLCPMQPTVWQRAMNNYIYRLQLQAPSTKYISNINSRLQNYQPAKNRQRDQTKKKKKKKKAPVM